MKIFISYRRDDSSGYAGRLFDHLSAHFGEKNVFIDIDTIVPGDDFRKVVQNAVGTCEVVLVMIGKRWLGVTDEEGKRRLDNPNDWVRMEVGHALSNPEVRVIPVLVQDAPMPDAEDLPGELKELAFRNAIELSDSRFQHDANRLIEVIEESTKERGKVPAGTGRFWGIGVGIVALLGLLFGIVSYALRTQAPTETPIPAAATSTATSTDLPTPTGMPSLVPSPTWTPSPLPATSTPSFTPPPTFTPRPPVHLSAEVQALDQYYKYINNAARQDDLKKAWSLLTKDFQCRSSKDCQFVPYRDYWWPRQVHYKLYDCGSGAVETELVYYGRAPLNDATPTSSFYIRYWLIKDRGQWKIDSGILIREPAAECKLAVSVQ